MTPTQSIYTFIFFCLCSFVVLMVVSVYTFYDDIKKCECCVNCGNYIKVD